MKSLLIGLVSVLAALLVFLPIYSIPLVLIYILFEDPKSFAYLAVLYTVIFCVFWVVYKLAEHPKTKKSLIYFWAYWRFLSWSLLWLRMKVVVADRQDI